MNAARSAPLLADDMVELAWYAPFKIF